MKPSPTLVESLQMGLIGVGLDLCVKAIHTPYTHKFFNQAICPGESLYDVLGLSEDEIFAFRFWISQIESSPSEGEWGQLRQQIPINEFCLPGEPLRHLYLDFIPQIDKGMITGLFLVLHDISELKAKEDKVLHLESETRFLAGRIDALLNFSPQELDVFFRISDEFFVFLDHLDDTEEFMVQWPFLLQELHTFKTNVKNYGFKEMVAVVHEMEDIILTIGLNNAVSEHTKSQWGRYFGLLREQFVAARQLCDKVSGRNNNDILVPREKYLVLHSLLSVGQPDLNKVRHVLAELDHAIFSDACAKYQSYIKYYREFKQRYIQNLVVEQPNERVPQTLMKQFDNILVHVFRLSLECSMEDKNTRLQLGKDSGIIKMSLQRDQNYLWVGVCDDGSGLALEAMCERAQEALMPIEHMQVHKNAEVEIELNCRHYDHNHDDLSKNWGALLGYVIMETAKYKGRLKIQSKIKKGCCVFIGLPHSNSFCRNI
jgi:hypothetical protein